MRAALTNLAAIKKALADMKHVTREPKRARP
jgi:hypothetical protein